MTSHSWFCQCGNLLLDQAHIIANQSEILWTWFLSQQTASEVDVNEKNASQQCNAVTGCVTVKEQYLGRLRVPFFPEGKDSSSSLASSRWLISWQRGWEVPHPGLRCPYSQMRHMGYTNCSPTLQRACILASLRSPTFCFFKPSYCNFQSSLEKTQISTHPYHDPRDSVQRHLVPSGLLYRAIPVMVIISGP